MEIVGLAFEFLFLFGGTYLYLYSIGKVNTNDPKKKKQSEEFRANNKWLKPLSLALIAIMVVNIFFHIQALIS